MATDAIDEFLNESEPLPKAPPATLKPPDDIDQFLAEAKPTPAPKVAPPLPVVSNLGTNTQPPVQPSSVYSQTGGIGTNPYSQTGGTSPEPKPPEPPTIGPSSPEGQQALLGGGQFHQHELEAKKESVEGPVRSFVDSATNQAFPYLEAHVNDTMNKLGVGPTNQITYENQKPTYEEELSADLARSQKFQEDHPVAAQLGGLLEFAVLDKYMPAQAAGLLGSAALGAVSGALGTWLASGMNASAEDLAGAAGENAFVGGVLHGLGETGRGEMATATKSGGHGMAIVEAREASGEVEYAKTLKPILAEPAHLAELNDELASFNTPRPGWASEVQHSTGSDIQLGPHGEESLRHNQEMVKAAQKANTQGATKYLPSEQEKNLKYRPVLQGQTGAQKYDPEERYKLAKVVSAISHSPDTVPVYAVHDLADITPVMAEITTPDQGKTFVVTVREVSSGGVGVFKERIESGSDARRFYTEWQKNHSGIGLSPTANTVAQMPDDVFDGLFPGGSKAASSNWKSTDPNATNSGRAPIPRAMEIPGGVPDVKPALVSVTSENKLKVEAVDSAEAKATSLLDRRIRAIKTKDGWRYGLNLTDADEGFTTLIPIDEHDIPTITTVSRVKIDDVKEPSHQTVVDLINKKGQKKVEYPDIVRSNRTILKRGYKVPEASLHRYGGEPKGTEATKTSYGLYYSTVGPQEMYNGPNRSLILGEPTGEKTWHTNRDYPAREALKKLDPALYDRLNGPEFMTKAEGKAPSWYNEKQYGPWENSAYNYHIPEPDLDALRAYIKKEYPWIDPSFHDEKATMLEIVGAQKLKEQGYDSIMSSDGQYVALRHTAVDYLRLDRLRKEAGTVGQTPVDVHVPGGEYFDQKVTRSGYDPDTTKAGQAGFGATKDDVKSEGIINTYDKLMGKIVKAKEINASLQQHSGGNGGKPPDPPTIFPESAPPAPPGQPPPPWDIPGAKLVATLKKTLGKGYNKLQREFQPEGVRADFDLGNVISDLQASKATANHQVAIQKALEKREGKNITKFREDVYEWANARKSDEQLMKDHPDAWANTQDILKDFEKNRDANHQRIIDLGGLDDESFTEAERGISLKKYVTRTYALHTMKPNKRMEILDRDTKALKEAAAGYQGWWKNKGNGALDINDAMSKVRDALSSDDPATMLFDTTGSGPRAKAGDNLRKRLDLPDWYRKMLGENRDGFFGVAKTIATQEAVIRNLEAWKAVSSNPEWCVPTLAGMEPGADKLWKPLPNNKRWYGDAAGKFVTNEVYDSMVTISNAHYEGNEAIQTIVGIQKANWFSLGRARTYVATMLDNFFYGAISGGVDPTRPLATGKAALQTVRALREYHKNPLANNELAQAIRDAKRLGVDEGGHIGPDIAGQARRQERWFLDNMATLPDGIKYTSFLHKIADVTAAIQRPGGAVFELSDRIHRLTSWKMITDDLMENPTQLDGKYSQYHGKLAPSGMPDIELAMRVAARQIMEYYPMYGRAAPLAKYMSRTAVGLASPTAMYAMERNRVMLNLPAMMIKDPGLKFRLMKFGVLGASMMGLNSMARLVGETYFGGPTDEDVAAADQEQGLGDSMFRPGSWTIPGIRTKTGQLIRMDFTQIAGPLQYLAGDATLSAPMKAIMNIGLGPFQGGLLGGAADSLLNQGGVKTGFPTRTVVPGESGGAAVGQSLINSGAIPAFIPEAYNNLASTGALGSGGRKQEVTPPWMAIAKQAGAPFISPMSTGQENNPSFQASVGGDISRLHELTGIITMAAQWPDDKKLPMLQKIVSELSNGGMTPEKKVVLDAAIAELKNVAGHLSDTSRLENDARISHQNQLQPRRIGGPNRMPTPAPRRIGVDVK